MCVTGREREKNMGKSRSAIKILTNELFVLFFCSALQIFSNGKFILNCFKIELYMFTKITFLSSKWIYKGRRFFFVQCRLPRRSAAVSSFRTLSARNKRLKGIKVRCFSKHDIIVCQLQLVEAQRRFWEDGMLVQQTLFTFKIYTIFNQKFVNFYLEPFFFSITFFRQISQLQFLTRLYKNTHCTSCHAINVFQLHILQGI